MPGPSCRPRCFRESCHSLRNGGGTSRSARTRAGVALARLPALRQFALLAIVFAVSSVATGGDSSSIEKVTLSRPFFNPSLRQTLQVGLSLLRPGTLTIDIVDPGGHRVRRLTESERVAAGRTVHEWNGKDDEQQVVPDEAYSLEVTFVAGGQTEKYSPRGTKPVEVAVSTPAYDARSGIVSYRLASPARVFLTAGGRSAEYSPARVVKVLVNRQPRIAGAVVESWNGRDEEGKLYLPELRDFSLQAMAEGLPENAIITIGNRKARAEPPDLKAGAQ